MSSIDMNRVMMFRRKRNPATPSANSTALRIRYQEIGTPVIVLFHLLKSEDHCSDYGDEDEDGGDFKRQQVTGKQRLAHVLRSAAGEGAEVHRARVGEQ